MEDIFIQIKPGKELTEGELSVINAARIFHFHSDTLIAPAPDNSDWDKLYILLYTKEHKLGAFARFHDLQIDFDGASYNILGSATLISLIPNKGYGRAIKKFMNEYSKGHGKTSIGFCNPKLSAFYKSLGCGIIVNGSTKFFQKLKTGELVQFNSGNDVLYIEGDDKLITKILAKSDLPVISYRSMW